MAALAVADQMVAQVEAGGLNDFDKRIAPNKHGKGFIHSVALDLGRR